MDDMTGRVIGNRFRIGEYIGRGASSRIYTAKDITSELNKNWAIKCVKKEGTPPEILEQYRNEIGILDNLVHPNMSGIVYSLEDDGHIYLVMNYINGDTLANKVKAEGPQNEEDVRRWADRLADVLGYLHQSGADPLVFCDTNPKNIMTDERGEPYLIDFGISRRVPRGRADTGPPMGTKGFAAPEQYSKGSRMLTEQTDVYGLSATLYFLLTGKPPEEGHTDVRELRPEVSKGLAALIGQGLSPDPSARPRGMAEYRRLLANVGRYNAGYLSKIKRQMAVCVMGVVAALMCLTGTGFAWHNLAQTNSREYTDAIANAESYSRLGEISDAKTSYLKAISVDPGQIEAYQGLYNLLEPNRDSLNYDGQAQEVVDTFRNSVDTDRLLEDPDLMLRLAQESMSLEEPIYNQYAGSLLEELAASGKYQDGDVNKSIVDSYLTVNQAEQAGEEEGSEEAVQEAVDTILKAAGSVKDPDERMELYFTVLQLYNLYPGLAESGELDALAEDIESTEASDFNKEIPLRRLLASRYYQLGTESGNEDYLAKAARAYESISAVDPSVDDAVSLGKIYARTGRAAEARDALHRALSYDPQNTGALLAMADLAADETIKAGSQDFTEARGYYNQLVAMPNLSSELLNQLNALNEKITGTGGTQ